MFTALIDPKKDIKRGFGVWRKMQQAISFTNSKVTTYRIEQRMRDDLERLAETSPHLLADIGVTSDQRDKNRQRCSPK